MIANISNEIKDFIKANEENLSPISIFNLTKDFILTLYQNNIKITDIHKLLEKELEININLNTLYKYIKKIKNEKVSSKATNKHIKKDIEDIFKKDSFKNNNENKPRILATI